MEHVSLNIEPHSALLLSSEPTRHGQSHGEQKININFKIKNNRKKEKMKKVFVFTMIVMAMTACTSRQIQVPEPTEADIPQAGIPNPASVYCTENGNKHEINIAADGSQNGVCIFPDGNTCDEWDYFRGECGPTAQNNPTPALSIEATKEGSGGGPGGGSSTPVNGIGGFMQPGTTEEFSDWWGIIKTTESGAQYDDYFERQDLGHTFINFGIDSLDQAVLDQIESLRDSGKIVHLYGTLFSNVPDYNGSQVQVDRMEIEG